MLEGLRNTGGRDQGSGIRDKTWISWKHWKLEGIRDKGMEAGKGDGKKTGGQAETGRVEQGKREGRRGEGEKEANEWRESSRESHTT